MRDATRKICEFFRSRWRKSLIVYPSCRPAVRAETTSVSMLPRYSYRRVSEMTSHAVWFCRWRHWVAFETVMLNEDRATLPVRLIDLGSAKA